MRGWRLLSRNYSLALLLVGWEVVARSGLFARDILPPFTATLARTADLLRDGELERHVLFSLARQASGLLLAVVAGVSLGVLMAWSRRVRDFFEPLLMLTNPIPKAALIPLFMLWFGIGTFSKIMLICAGTVIPIVISAFHAVADVNRNHIWSARAMGDGPLRTLVRVVLPAASPQILSGIRLGLIVSLIVLVGSEMLAGREGLGWLIAYTMETGAYDLTYAAILTIAIVGFCYDRLFLLLMGRLLAWQERAT
ncbi:MAG TPA: ABC transporter permease [Candidatus Methylomirabilis sp.]|nr:ABC transporter permease [Candidatus Methylomirabilis sp.]